VVELAAQLRDVHRAGGGWNESFHQIFIEAMGEYVVRCAHRPAGVRVLEHLAYLGERPATHDEIAAAAALSRETVTRALKVLQAEGRVVRLAVAPGRWAYRVARGPAPGEVGRAGGASRAPELAIRAPHGPGSPRLGMAGPNPFGPVGRGGVESATSRARRG